MRGWQSRRWAALFAIVGAALALAGQAGASDGSKPPSLQFLGQAIFPTGYTFGGTTVGGLSSITYDADRGVFYSLSDDQSQFAPARFYTLRVDVANQPFGNGSVQFQGVTTLLAPDGRPYAPFSLDPEGLTLTKDRQLVLTSEGFANRGIPAFARIYDLDGSFARELTLPAAFAPTPTHGIRQNLALEAAAVAPNGRTLFLGMESALIQDGPAASLTTGSPSRLLRYNLLTDRLERESVYMTDPIAQAPVPATAFAVSGLVELLPFNDEFMLSMERSFSVGAPTLGNTGNTIKLYSVAIPGADNIDGADSIVGLNAQPVQKTLLLNLDALHIPLDNVEGMTIGPRLPDGRRSLVLVSDNNFAPSQFTQFLLFALGN
jgi:hypothetical protein